MYFFNMDPIYEISKSNKHWHDLLKHPYLTKTEDVEKFCIIETKNGSNLAFRILSKILNGQKKI